MKKKLLFHLVSFSIFFAAVVLVRFDVRIIQSFIGFLIGGFIGSVLPDIDQLIYIFAINPEETKSIEVKQMFSEGKYWAGAAILFETRDQRRLIFHTVLFQIFFTLFAFFVVTSAGSVFGRGIVLGFLLHLSLDQITNLMEGKTLSSWFEGLSSNIDHTRTVFYTVLLFVSVLLLGFFF